MCPALSVQEAERRVPGLATEGRYFCWMEEPSLNPRDLCAALPLAAAAAGVELQQETEATVTSRNSAVEVKTGERNGERRRFRKLLRGVGWGVRHSGLERPPAAAVEPRKGQMLAVRVPPPLDLQYVLRSPEIYLVPRGEGLIVIGATVESAGFDRRVEPLVVEQLRARRRSCGLPWFPPRWSKAGAGFVQGRPTSYPLSVAPGCRIAGWRQDTFVTGFCWRRQRIGLRQLLQGARPRFRWPLFSPGV